MLPELPLGGVWWAVKTDRTPPPPSVVSPRTGGGRRVGGRGRVRVAWAVRWGASLRWDEGAGARRGRGQACGGASLWAQGPR